MRNIFLILLLSTPLLAQTDRVIKHLGVDQDIKFIVNDGGTPTEAMIIDGASGRLQVDSITGLAGSGGPSFSEGIDITSASGSFYEENDTWTPTVTLGTNTSGTPSVDWARYTKIGRQYFCSFRITGIDQVANNSFTSLTVEGLPANMGDSSGKSARSVGGGARLIGPSGKRVLRASAVDASSINSTTVQISWGSDTSVGALSQVEVSFFYSI